VHARDAADRHGAVRELGLDLATVLPADRGLAQDLLPSEDAHVKRPVGVKVDVVVEVRDRHCQELVAGITGQVARRPVDGHESPLGVRQEDRIAGSLEDGLQPRIQRRPRLAKSGGEVPHPKYP
jgi:hypothetical protein